jgi:HK97 family phage major capsid protein
MRIGDLIEERARLVGEMREILDTAENESRDLTAEDRQGYDERDARVQSIEGDIRRHEAASRAEQADIRGIADDEPDSPETRQAPGTDTDEYRDAFVGLIRAKGHISALGDEQRATLNITTPGQGGYTVPDVFYRDLQASLREFGTIRSLAKVITTSDAGTVSIPKVATRTSAAWRDEGDPFAASEPTFDQAQLKAHGLGAMSKITEELVNDSAFDLLAFLAEDLGEALALQENVAFASAAANASDRPKGLVPLTPVGKTTVFADKVSGDELIDIVHSLKRPYRKNARWLLNDQTLVPIRKLKTKDGQYLWQPGLQAGSPDLLLGYPLDLDPDVPDVDAETKPIVFGDVRRAYWIRDVLGVQIRILGERYADTGHVGVRAWKRTDGNLVDAEAVRALKMGTADSSGSGSGSGS